MWHLDPIPGYCLPLRGFAITLIGRTTLGTTPLDGWSARRRGLYLTTHNTHNRQTSTLPAIFEPTIPASEWPQTHALDRAATGTGLFTVNRMKFEITVGINRLVLCNSVTADGWLIETECLRFSYANISWKVAVESTAAEGRGLKIRPEAVRTGCWNSCFFSVIPG